MNPYTRLSSHSRKRNRKYDRRRRMKTDGRSVFTIQTQIIKRGSKP